MERGGERERAYVLNLEIQILVAVSVVQRPIRMKEYGYTKVLLYMYTYRKLFSQLPPRGERLDDIMQAAR